jgi:hypothetical protein
MSDPHSQRMLLNRHELPSRKADFFRCLRYLADQVRRLPQSLCVLLTHTPLTQDGCRYSLFECEEDQRLGQHWRMEGEYYEWGHLPNFVRGTDRFPFGVVLSQRSRLLDLAVDSKNRTWFNFGEEGGFYVAGKTAKVSPLDGKMTHEKSEMTIWHYFATDMGEPTPDESKFASVKRQLVQCYRGIQDMVTPRSSPAFSPSWMRASSGRNCFTSLALSFAECVSPESTSLSSSLCLRFAAACGHTSRGCRPNFRGRGTRNTPLRRLV